MSQISAASNLDASQGVPGPENVSTVLQVAGIPGLAALRQAWKEAAAWMDSAMRTVTAVYPSCDWGRSVDPAVDDEFHFALEGRFLYGTLNEEDFRAVWRKWYKAHL